MPLPPHTMPAPMFEVRYFLGPQVIINLISAFLAGVATVQVYIYYQTFRNDGRLLKILIGSLWLLDMVHTAMTSAGFYQLAIEYFGEPEKFAKAPTVLLAALFLAAPVYFLVQSFFSYRVWMIVHIRTIGVLSWAMTLLRGGTAIGMAAMAVTTKTWKDFTEHYGWLLTLSIISASVGDILTALSLSWALWRQKSGLYEGTSQMVDRVILWTMQTGLLTSMATTLLLIFFFTMPQNYIWKSILYIIPRLYTNSLLSSLNGRRGLRELVRGRTFRSFRSSDMPGPNNHPPMSIEMVTTFHIEPGQDASRTTPKTVLSLHRSPSKDVIEDLESIQLENK